MSPSQPASGHSGRRLFAVHAAVSLIPVVVIGLLLVNSSVDVANDRGLAEAKTRADSLASSVVGPVLRAEDLGKGITHAEKARLDQIAAAGRTEGTVLRLRLRDLEGRVVYSSDRSGLDGVPDPEAAEAGRGAVLTEFTRLNSDVTDVGPAGDDVVEVYRAIHSNADADRAIGVLEVYLPYAEIRDGIQASTARIQRDLVVGLAVLYVVLAGLSFTSTRRIRRHARETAFLASHDRLTGLLNRDAFLKVIVASTTSTAPVVVAVVDLDRFKDANDTLGHDVGDQLLVQLGDRLRHALGPADEVARIGGDEFGVVLTGVTGRAQAEATLRRVRDTLGAPMDVAGLPLTLESSIGYSLTTGDATGAQTLLRQADIALSVSKTTRTPLVGYDAAHDVFDADRLALAAELDRALVRDELVLHYQPKLDLAEGTISSVEALVRWNHPRRGLLQPATFLPAAEQTSLVDPLTDWVLREALRQLAAWDEEGLSLTVAVNVSARNFAQPAFAGRVLRAVEDSGVAPTRLVLEITETALFSDVDKATAALSLLQAAGLRISIDDFGQGQTSLGYLSRLPVDELKIDREFVTTMCDDAANAAIVRSVVELAHNLGLHVVAEGAEDERTVEALRAVTCDTVQGYAVSRPLTASSLAAVVELEAAARGTAARA